MRNPEMMGNQPPSQEQKKSGKVLDTVMKTAGVATVGMGLVMGSINNELLEREKDSKAWHIEKDNEFKQQLDDELQKNKSDLFEASAKADFYKNELEKVRTAKTLEPPVEVHEEVRDGKNMRVMTVRVGGRTFESVVSVEESVAEAPPQN